MYLLTSMTLAVVRNLMSDSDPCYVMSLETIMELDHLITHEEALHADPPLVHVVSRASAHPSPAHCYFISQNWVRLFACQVVPLFVCG